jgi:hypothetical protein
VTQVELVSVTKQDPRCAVVDIDAIDRDITQWDQDTYREIISTELTAEQIARIVEPEQTYPKQENVLAVHWHPEFVPLDVVRKRIDAMYPGKKKELIIPTQHNIIMEFGDYAGVEVDCYSSGFNRKVQLLLHFEKENVAEADVLRSMLDHTFRYRTSQLFDFLETLVDPKFEDRLQRAAGATNTEADVVTFSSIHAAKLKKLIDDNWSTTPRESIKNKLLREYLDKLRELYGDSVINRAQVFVKAVKKIVKEHFSLKYFYRATEVIEEARMHGGCIVIPHPEQFWPILLADYDVDGIEVWNPQSYEYTEFLIQAVQRQNKLCAKGNPMLIFMGDDCHMSEKTKDPEHQSPEKAARQIGLQPAWDDLQIRKSLILYGVTRDKVIDEYKARLAG